MALRRWLRLRRHNRTTCETISRGPILPAAWLAGLGKFKPKVGDSAPFGNFSAVATGIHGRWRRGRNVLYGLLAATVDPGKWGEPAEVLPRIPPLAFRLDPDRRGPVARDGDTSLARGTSLVFVRMGLVRTWQHFAVVFESAARRLAV